MNYTIANMVGKIPTQITQEFEEITFHFSDGMVARFLHHQDCCESVTVEDVNGDWGALIGVPLLIAEERVSVGPDEDIWESHTYTFYTFRSIKGSVDVRWYGTSNGYYSESVDFEMK